MSQKDRLKWERKYAEQAELLKPRDPSALLVDFYKEAAGKSALELACGTGRNALFLARNGFMVDAVDISKRALDILKKRAEGLNLNIIEADLDEFDIEDGRFDLVVITNYLDRDLIKRAAKALKPNGVFITETYMEHRQNEKPDSNPDYLLRPGELKELFGEGFDILEYKEFWNGPDELYKMRKQGIVAKKR